MGYNCSMAGHALIEPGFDVIGDVHGQAHKLERLLTNMGYTDNGATWAHPLRQAIFVGDLIDRGPRQTDVYRIARSMQQHGSALVIAGNHEFNAAAWHTPHTGTGKPLREHSEKNFDQHKDFLIQIGSGTALHDEIVQWFMTLPLWLDADSTGGLRVAHACWDPNAISLLAELTDDHNNLTPDLLQEAATRDTQEWRAVEHLLKGPEIPIDPPYLDKGGHERDQARFQWWNPNANTRDQATWIPSDAKTSNGEVYPPIAAEPIEPPVSPYCDATPVVYGHYWFTGTPAITGPYTACVDYSAGKGGPLVSYRWSGESELTADNFAASSTFDL